MFKNTNKYLKGQNNMTALAFPLYENSKQRTCILYKVLAVNIIITSSSLPRQDQAEAHTKSLHSF